MHKARSTAEGEFKPKVEKELTGKEREPWEMIYFKLYKSQIPVIEQAIETAALMLGTYKSRGYCLEMICADFLAGAHLKTAIRRSCFIRSCVPSSSFPGEERKYVPGPLAQEAS